MYLFKWGTISGHKRSLGNEISSVEDSRPIKFIAVRKREPKKTFSIHNDNHNQDQTAHIVRMLLIKYFIYIIAIQNNLCDVL